MTRSQADELSFPVVRAYLDAEDEILRMIAEQLAADGDPSDTSKWRIRQLARAGALDRKAIEIIKSYIPVVSDETDELITAAAMSEIAYTDAAFQRAAADGIKGIAVEVPAEVTAFKVMKRFKKQAHHDLNLVNTVMGYETKKVYRKAVNEVYNAVHHELGRGTASVIMGQESLQSAVRSTIRRMSQTGIPGFVDAAGHEWSPEAYVTMDLRTTAANTARQAQFDRCDDYGIDLIEVSSHMGARPLCAPYQGRIYSRSGASGSTKDGAGRTVYYSPLSLTSYGEPAGLFGINCGHQCYPFVPGANIQRYFPYDDEENAKAYEKSQVQRKLERDIRASKRECMMLDAAGDKEGYTKAAQKLKARRENYKAYCKANDLGTQPERTQVYGFDRSQSSKATWAARKAGKG